MERISNNIANKIASELNLDEDKREVINYGTFNLLQILLSIFLVTIFGLMLHVAIEALIISFTAAILRKYSGGVHASSPSICTLIGIIVPVGQATIVSLWHNFGYNLNLIIVLAVMIFIWSYYLIYKLVPVDSINKPIKKIEKRKRMKKGSIIVLSVYLIIAVFCIGLFINTGSIKSIVYTYCLYSGIVWQIFTLTELGHLIFGKIDTFLSYILLLKRR